MSIARVTAGQAITAARVNQGIWATTVISSAPTIDDTAENHIYTLNGASGNVTVVLPTLADNQTRMFIFINDDTTYDLIIDGEGGETIGGQTTITLTKRGQVLTIVGQANEWEIIGGNIFEALTVIRNGTTSGGTIDANAQLAIDTSTYSLMHILGGSAHDMGFLIGTSANPNICRILYNSTDDNLEFWTGDVMQMSIDTNGNVGIGTSGSNDVLLHIEDSSANSSPNFQIQNDAQRWIIGINGSSGDLFRVRDSNLSADRMQIHTDGSIFFNALSGSTGGSDARYNTSSRELFYDTSSIKYKKNIKDSKEDDVLWLLSIPVKKYDRKDGSKKDEIGIIAEDLQQIKPDAVSYIIENEEEIKEAKEKKETEPEPVYSAESYSKSDLVPSLLKLIQIQDQKIKDLEARVAALEV